MNRCCVVVKTILCKYLNYYKLKQTDYNGTNAYSEIVAVNFIKSLKNAVIFPKPAENSFHLKFEYPFAQGEVTVEIHDALGSFQKATVNEVVFGVNELIFSTESLPQGVYNVSISAPSQRINSVLIIAKPK